MCWPSLNMMEGTCLVANIGIQLFFGVAVGKGKEEGKGIVQARCACKVGGAQGVGLCVGKALI